MRLNRLEALIVAVCLAITSFFLAQPSFAADPTWDQVAKSGVVRIGVIPNRPPYFWQEDKQWVGFSAEMGKDLAKALSAAFEKEIKPDFVITSWTTVILDLQANKIDAFSG